MDLQTRKLELIKAFLHLQSEELISAIEQLIHKEKAENKISPMTIEEFHKRVDNSLADSKNGKIKTHQNVKSIIDQWN